MARTGVTYEDVANAATTLKSNGQNPTIEQIRALLGTGSSTTLARHLREWKEKIATAGEIARKAELPTELVGSIKSLWKELQARTDETLTDHRQKYQQEVIALQGELTKYKHNNMKWQRLYQQLQIEKSAWLKKCECLEGESTQREIAMAVLQKELSEKEARVEEWQDRVRQLQVNFEALQQTAHEERILAEARCDRIKEEAREEWRRLREEMSVAKAREEKLMAQSRDCQAKRDKQESQLLQLQEAMTTMSEQLADSKSTIKEFSDRLNRQNEIENDHKRLLIHFNEMEKMLQENKKDLENKDEIIRQQIKQMKRMNDSFEKMFVKG